MTHRVKKMTHRVNSAMTQCVLLCCQHGVAWPSALTVRRHRSLAMRIELHFTLPPSDTVQDATQAVLTSVATVRAILHQLGEQRAELSWTILTRPDIDEESVYIDIAGNTIDGLTNVLVVAARRALEGTMGALLEARFRRQEHGRHMAAARWRRGDDPQQDRTEDTLAAIDAIEESRR